MKKLMSIAAAVACLCLTAQAERVGLDFSVTANGVTAASVTMTGLTASDTNWCDLAAMVVTVPALSSATLEFNTQVGGVNAQMGQTLTLANASSNAVTRYIMPRQITASSRNTGAERFALYGTNTSFTVTQSVTGTNEWAIKLLIER